MRWQQAARFGVAAVGVGTAVALFVLRRQPPPVAAPAPVIAVKDKSARMEGGPCRTRLTDLSTGKDRGEIECAASQHYDDGRNRYEKIHLTRTDDPPFELWADVLESRGRGVRDATLPGELVFTGHVRMKTKDGLQVDTDRATYDDGTGIITMPGAVTFVKGRLSGRGVGATYNRGAQTFEFLDQAHADVAPDAEGKGAARATSKMMTMLRGSKMLRLDQKASIVTATETLAADVEHLYFTDDEQSIRYLELRGHASVMPASASSGTPEMRSDNMTLTFHPDGRTLQHATLTTQASVVLIEGTSRKSIQASWIDLYTGADGRTVTRLDAKDRVVVVLPPDGSTPARTIRSAALTTTGDEKGLKAALFEKDVSFEEREQPANGPPRLTKATSVQLILTLKGKLDAIEAAEFRQNVEFVDGTMRARADRAEYREAQGQLALFQNDKPPRKIPNVTDNKVQVDATQIDINTNTHDLTATGAVRTLTQPDPEAGKKPGGGLFNDKEPIRGLAERFVYTNATGKAIYTGSATTTARVFQGKSEVLGDEVRLDDVSQNLDASGRVSTTFEMTVAAGGASKTAKPTDYHVTAATFHYEDAKRIATYEGKNPPVVMKGTDGETEGQKIVLRLAKDSRSLEQMHVEGGDQDLYTKMSGGYESTGAILDYDVATDIYVLTGRPVKVKSPRQDGGKGPARCDLTRGLKIVLNRKDGSVRVLDQGGVPGGTDTMNCDQSLRTIR